MNIIKRVAASALALAALTTAASAADIKTRPCGDDEKASCQEIAIFGAIQPDDGDKFGKLVADKGITKSAVWLNSYGGNVMAAIKIGREIRRLGFTTLVPNDWVCMSACADIWLAGSRRLYEGRAKIGFHAPYFKPDPKSKSTQAPVASTGASAVTGAYYAELGLSDKAIYYLKSAAPNQMFWFSVEAAEKLGIAIENLGETVKKDEAKRKAEAEQQKAQPAPAKPAQPAPAPTATGPLEIKRVNVIDQPLQLDFVYALNPDCSSIGVARVLTIEEPKHGKMTVERTAGFSNFREDNPRSACNRRRSDGMPMSYRPDPGYLGSDAVTVDVIYGDGTSRQRRYAITVAPKPPARELKRVALAEQRARIGFLFNVDPDCSSTPFADVRIVDEPKYGNATIEAGTGFTNFEKGNSRFECNQQKTDGTAVWYRSDAGYAGPDSLTVEISYADGRQTSLRYAIEVK